MRAITTTLQVVRALNRRMKAHTNGSRLCIDKDLLKIVVELTNHVKNLIETRDEHNTRLLELEAKVQALSKRKTGEVRFK